MSDLNFDGFATLDEAKKVLSVPIYIEEKNMSNYPPGVTGNEYAIAGPDREIEEEDWECSNDSYQVAIVPKALIEACKRFSYGNYQTAEIQKRIDSITHHMFVIGMYVNDYDIDYKTVKCGYFGGVIKHEYRGRIFWECPKCHHEYEYEVDDYYGYDGD